MSDFFGLMSVLIITCIIIRPCLKARTNREVKKTIRYDIHYEIRKDNGKVKKKKKTVYKTPKFNFEKIEV